jgi:multiple sugar transport system substrate-binding protein
MKLGMALGLLLGVASGLAAATAARADSFTLWARSDDVNFVTPLVAEYNRTHPDQVRLSLIVASQLVQKFAASLAGGSAPDALSLDLVYVPAFASAGVLRDVGDWARTLPYRDHLPRTHLRQGLYEGRTYGMPFSAEGSILLYNKALFRQAGLDPQRPPQDWASLLADAERVHALGRDIHGFFFSAGCGGCQVFEFTPLLWASGGDVLSEDGSHVAVDTPIMRRTVQLYRDLVARAGVPPAARVDNGGYGVTGFAAGKVGMENLGAFAIGILDAKYPGFDYGVAPIPGEHGGHASFAGGDDIVLTRTTRHAAAIERFIEWSYTLPAQRLLAAHGSLPVRLDLADAALAGLDPRLAVSEQGVREGHTPYSTVFNDLFNNSNGPWAAMLGRAIFEADPDRALRRGQNEMQEIIERNRPDE